MFLLLRSLPAVTLEIFKKSPKRGFKKKVAHKGYFGSKKGNIIKRKEKERTQIKKIYCILVKF